MDAYCPAFDRNEQLICPRRHDSGMDERLRTYGSLAGAILLVVGGTLLTGVLPPTPRSQLVAGLVIVAGFALGYVGLVGVELPE